MPLISGSWAQEAQAFPLFVAQVREDASVDQWVVDQLAPNVRVIMVASGGCTAAALAGSSRVSRMVVVDPNPAQIALSRLKLHLLRTEDPQERLRVLGHEPMGEEERRERTLEILRFLDIRPEILGPIEHWSLGGLDYSGRYEFLYAKLRNELTALSDELEALFELADPEEQSRRIDPSTALGRTFDQVAGKVMDGSNLEHIFWKGAPFRRPFSIQFTEGVRRCLATLPARTNPYLAQVLLGHFKNDSLLPWLSLPVPSVLPSLSWATTGMTQALDSTAEEFDYVHLSNVFDLLSEAESRDLLDSAWRALRRGGMVLIRQLDSVRNVLTLESGFDWKTDTARALHAGDRSFLYRDIHIGVKE